MKLARTWNRTHFYCCQRLLLEKYSFSDFATATNPTCWQCWWVLSQRSGRERNHPVLWRFLHLFYVSPCKTHCNGRTDVKEISCTEKYLSEFSQVLNKVITKPLFNLVLQSQAKGYILFWSNNLSMPLASLLRFQSYCQTADLLRYQTI